MTILVPDVSEIILLKNFLNIEAPQELVVRLYSSDTTPSDTDTAATYTEVAGGGYAPIALNPLNWVLTPGTPSDAAYPQLTFAFSGAIGNVYGYFVTQFDSGSIMWAERFDGGPYNIANNGDEIRIAISITLD
jgi:hypothetical protein